MNLDPYSETYQWMRIADVVLVGPLMLKAANGLSGTERDLLQMLAVGTIVFNALTFLEVRQGGMQCTQDMYQ